jgi:osmoprotectant transport system permease protein
MPIAEQTFTFQKQGDWQWVTSHFSLFWSLSRTHLYLALAAVALGFLVALPLGLLAVRLPRTYPPILAITTVLYALPSLAYALAILVRSVVGGLRNVPEQTRTAAVAMGYRPVRRLLSVELPIAVPVIIGGLRVATVASISLVTVGSLIGIGGLGQLFITGENSDFLTEVAAGVVIVAFWALLCDGLWLVAGYLLAPWNRERS